MAAPAIKTQTRGSLRAVIVPALSLGVRVADPGPDANSVTRPRTTREFLAQQPQVLAACNGPMFDYCRSERTRTYAGYQCASSKTALFDPGHNVNLPGHTPEDGITLYVMPDGSSGSRRGAHWPEGARLAIQFYPTLVRDGRPTEGLSNLEPNTRSAVARLADGRFAMVVGTGIGNPAFAQALARESFDGARVTDAGYTDGSGSSALWAKASSTSSALSFNVGGRRIVAWITAEDRGTVAARLQEAIGANPLVKVGLGAVFLLGAGYLLAAR